MTGATYSRLHDAMTMSCTAHILDHLASAGATKTSNVVRLHKIARCYMYDYTVRHDHVLHMHWIVFCRSNYNLRIMY